MYEKLAELINTGNWEQAEQELAIHQRDEWTDELAILAATVFFQKGWYEDAYESIRRGLLYNYKNYELYLLLGNYYVQKNINQAWLCYENAVFYCDNPKDMEIILEYKAALENSDGWKVRKTSIVILSYNLKEITQQCIESIRQNNPASSYEIVVVDNNSGDGIREWLQEQEDIKLVCNSENVGFPCGCNQGIELADSENNIFLLNNDTVVPPNAIFWLRMGLYEQENIGATGSVSNYVVNGQMIMEKYNTLEEYLAYGERNNLPRKKPYEKKIFLVGFALLLKKEALDSVGVLDERFTPGQYEDNDMGIRMHNAGWQVLLCRNSFIYHYGSGGGKYKDSWNQVAQKNAEKLKEKWKFDIRYYTWARGEIIKLITHDINQPIEVLEIGCGLGATLAKIEYFWPKAKVHGIEILESVAKIGSSYLDIIQGNIETMEIPYVKGQFDYIILADILEHLHEPEKIVKQLMPYLKQDGAFLCSISNLMHVSVLLPLLQGQFDYQEAGILDRTHIRFFTLDSIRKLFEGCGLRIEELSGKPAEELTQSEEKMLDVLEMMPGIASRETFNIYQYIFRAKKR